MSITVVELPDAIVIESVDARALAEDDGFWQLYNDSFPSNEREPRDVILATVEREAGFVLRARAGKTTVGLAAAHSLRTPAATFVVYLAVHPAWRSHHLGTAILNAVDEFGAERLMAQGLESIGMVWEIDDPGDNVTDEEHAVRLRRRGFFERAGGRPLDVRYRQPPVDGRTPVRMQLMFRPSASRRLPDRTALTELIRAIYFEKYHTMNGIPAPVLTALLQDC
jgi:GNAT superfamily N-acetyltransferase